MGNWSSVAILYYLLGGTIIRLAIHSIGKPTKVIY